MKKVLASSLFWVCALSLAVGLASWLGIGRLQANELTINAAPGLINYQGHLRDLNGEPFSGQAALKFAIYDAEMGGTLLWSETHLNTPVNSGNFAVKLGSNSPLSAMLFNGPGRYLQLSVDLTNTDTNYTDFPRQQFTAVPYAFQADTVPWSGITDMPAGFADGIDDGGGVAYEYVVTVAKSGGDYTTISAAMASITPTMSSRYLVWVAPGSYEEQVTVKPYVHLKGSGAGITYVRSAANGSHNNATSATLIVPANSQVSDLTAENTATTLDGVAIYIDSGNNNTVLRNVKAQATGMGGDRHDGIYVRSGTAVLETVHAEATGGTLGNWAVFTNAGSPTINNSTLIASGGTTANALRLNGGNPIIRNSTLRADLASSAYAVEGTGAGAHTVRFDHAALFGEDFGIRLSSGNYTVYVGASLVEGGGNAFSGIIRCVSSYKADYTAINATCN